MRVPALLCICLAIIGAGVAYARQCRRRVRALEGFSRYFGALALHARVAGGALGELLSAKSVLPGARFPFTETLAAALVRFPPEQAWREAVSRCAEAKLLKTDERAFLAAFNETFRGCALEAFCDTCALYEKKCAALYREAALRNEKAQKLGVTFASLLAALTFLILF